MDYMDLMMIVAGLLAIFLGLVYYGFKMDEDNEDEMRRITGRWPKNRE